MRGGVYVCVCEECVEIDGREYVGCGLACEYVQVCSVADNVLKSAVKRADIDGLASATRAGPTQPD